MSGRSRAGVAHRRAIETEAVKVFLYTVVPAGFVTSVPTQLIGDPDAGMAAAVAAVASTALLAGWWTFRAGLRRYTSGAFWASA